MKGIVVVLLIFFLCAIVVGIIAKKVFGIKD